MGEPGILDVWAAGGPDEWPGSSSREAARPGSPSRSGPTAGRADSRADHSRGSCAAWRSSTSRSPIINRGFASPPRPGLLIVGDSVMRIVGMGANRVPGGWGMPFRSAGAVEVLARPCPTMLAILANGPHHGRRLEVPAEHDYVALPTTDDPASTTAAIYRKHGPGLAPGDVDLRCSKGAVCPVNAERDWLASGRAVYFVHERTTVARARAHRRD